MMSGFTKSPSAVLRSPLITAAYILVRLALHGSQALHLELFAVPWEKWRVKP
jgi:hypothetical protein